jgi:hypothetical protein
MNIIHVLLKFVILFLRQFCMFQPYWVTIHIHYTKYQL